MVKDTYLFKLSYFMLPEKDAKPALEAPKAGFNQTFTPGRRVAATRWPDLIAKINTNPLRSRC
jgi:hypothetical protein